MKSIKIEDSIHEWLLDHRNSKRRTISSVIKGLIDDSVAIQLIGMKLETKNKGVGRVSKVTRPRTTSPEASLNMGA